MARPSTEGVGMGAMLSQVPSAPTCGAGACCLNAHLVECSRGSRAFLSPVLEAFSNSASSLAVCVRRAATGSHALPLQESGGVL